MFEVFARRNDFIDQSSEVVEKTGLRLFHDQCCGGVRREHRCVPIPNDRPTSNSKYWIGDVPYVLTTASSEVQDLCADWWVRGRGRKHRVGAEV